MSDEQSDAGIERRGIIWLASFPKSGNTWFRIFLRHLLGNPGAAFNLRAIGFGMSSDRQVFDHFSGIDSSDLTLDEIDELRPRVYEDLFRASNEARCFLKTHDAYTYLPDGRPLLSRKATAGAVYLIRNPLDVAVSIGFHDGADAFDEAIARMENSDSAMCQGLLRLQPQLRQKLLGWSGHVKSWKEADIPVHIMRYEDMKAEPLASFTKAVQFAGIERDMSEIEFAMEQSRFKNLQKLERDHGFRERPSSSQSFFRKGESGSWREYLNDEQVAKIIKKHREMMFEFGYLSKEGTPIF